MSNIEIGRYGVTENAVAELVTANEMVGGRAGQFISLQSAVGDSVGPSMDSTAPYRPPSRDERVAIELSDPKYCHGPGKKGFGKCRAFHRTDSLYCYAHRGLDESAAAS